MLRRGVAGGGECLRGEIEASGFVRGEGGGSDAVAAGVRGLEGAGWVGGAGLRWLC